MQRIEFNRVKFKKENLTWEDTYQDVNKIVGGFMGSNLLGHGVGVKGH